MAGLLQNRATKLRIGVVSEVFALVDESDAIGVHHHAQEVANLAIILAFKMRDIEVAEILHVKVHRRCMASAVEAIFVSAQAKGKFQPITGIVGCAAHLSLVPMFANVLFAKVRARFKSTTA